LKYAKSDLYEAGNIERIGFSEIARPLLHNGPTVFISSSILFLPFEIP
jgi:hypothetical protein